MESINVRQKLRPIRYAFLIRPDDSAGLVRAVSLNTILWGGLFNAIVATPAEDRDGLLREFDPDYLVDLTGEPVPREITTAFEDRIVGPDDILRYEDPTGQHSRRLKLGFGMGAILQFAAHRSRCASSSQCQQNRNSNPRTRRVK